MLTSEKVVNLAGTVSYTFELLIQARHTLERPGVTAEDIAIALEGLVYRWEPKTLSDAYDLFKHIYNLGFVDTKEEHTPASKGEAVAEKNAEAKTATKTWLVDGPGGTWSIWDFGDELTVHDGPTLLDRVVAKVPPEKARKMSAEHKWQHVTNAAGAIHVAKLLGSDTPTFRLLWN